jgi:hypothetical protein
VSCLQTTRGWFGACGLGALVVALVAPGAARAASLHGAVDPNDTPGRLDIRSVTQRHGRTGPVAHTITMYEPWRGRLLGIQRSSAIFLTFDTHGGRAYERFAAVFFARGRLRAAVYTRAGRFLGWGTVTRLNRRSITVTVRRRLLGSPKGYRWYALSLLSTTTGPCRAGCVDRAPNRGVLVHDLTAPSVSFPAVAGVPASTATALAFSVADTGKSGLGGWVLERRVAGAAAWSQVASGWAPGVHRVPADGIEGATVSYRVVARDRGGNVTVSPVRSLTFPVDDANAAMTYAGTWTTAGAGAGDYQRTLHTSTDTATPATVTFSFQGPSVALLAHGSCGTAAVTVDGAAGGDTASRCAGEHRTVVFRADGLASGPHTVVLTVDGGTFAFDGATIG